jgi:hypothetical protein
MTDQCSQVQWIVPPSTLEATIPNSKRLRLTESQSTIWAMCIYIYLVIITPWLQTLTCFILYVINIDDLCQLPYFGISCNLTCKWIYELHDIVVYSFFSIVGVAIQEGACPSEKPDKPLGCDMCKEGFSFSGHLNKHCCTLSRGSRFICEICGKGFTKSGDLGRHRRTHTGDKPFKCDICGKGFTQTGNVNTHRRKHTGEKPYKCNVCGKEFSYRGNLVPHQRRHTGEKPYRCDICGKGFSVRGNVMKHRRIHSGEQPFKCDICGKGFSEAGTLVTHLRTHTGEKPFECDLCGKGFSVRGSIIAHLQTHPWNLWDMGPTLCVCNYKLSYTHCTSCRKVSSVMGIYLSLNMVTVILIVLLVYF